MGIEKGKEFKPDRVKQAVLKKAAQEAKAWFMQELPTYGVQFRPDRKWLVPVPPIGPQTGDAQLAPNGFRAELR